ncbi:MAG: insulinase family protein [Rickettsiaceae bacterium]|nr:insulinase family protein [Rickettsiaceae bacterium]
MPHVSSVAINIIVDIGSRYELATQSGITHFLEHMAFKGTKRRNYMDIAREFDAIGGHFNAYTSREHTVYYAKSLHQNFPKALDILADILQNSVFDEKEIQKELAVITQEIAEVQDNPDELVHEKLFQIAYPEQALGRSVIGTFDHIKNFSQLDFKNYIKQHYNTNNITISMAGNISHEHAIIEVEKLFTNLPAKTERPAYDKAYYVGGQSYIKKDLEQTTIILGFEAPSYNKIKDFYHGQILSVIFGGGLSSRLFQRIREELALAYSVGSWQHSFSDSGIFGISASCEHNRQQELTDSIFEEINKIQDFISEEELDRAKSQIETSIHMAEEKPEYKSEEIGKNFALFGKFISSEEVIDTVNKTCAKDLTDIATKIFSSPISLAKIGPNDNTK